jgi:AraC-like DNA-binding protein
MILTFGDISLTFRDMPLTPLARSAALSDYVDVARSVGLEPLRMVDVVGIPRAAINDPDLKISATSVVRLLELSAERAGVEDFALRIASRRKLSSLGAFGLVVREQPTIRKVIDTVIEYSWIQNEGVAWRLDEASGLVILGVAILSPPPGGARQSTELALAILVLSLRALLGENWHPQLVCFEHSAPSNAQPHQRVFNCPVEFNHDFSGVILSRRDLELPIPRGDPATARQLEKLLDEAAGQRRTSPEETVRQLVRDLLPTGQCTAERTARHLGIDRRTLQRHLADHKSSFSQILDQERSRLAKSYLIENTRSLSDISVLLGFSCLSAFSRWHARRHGVTASARRKASRPGNSIADRSH